MPPLDIRLLGGFHVKLADEVFALSERIQALVTWIILHGEGGCSRAQLAFAFWPESGDKQARTNLRRLLLLTRRALPQADQLFELSGSQVTWAPRVPVHVDLLLFEEGIAAALESGPARRKALEEALAAYGGDLLPDCYDEWILPERERLRNAYAQTLDTLTLLAENRRDYPAAIGYVRRLLEHDPLHEASHRQLMQLLAFTGDRAGALQRYHACATLLRRELGVDPGPETQQLYTQLLHQEGGAGPSPGPAVSPGANRLVGRQAEWQTLQDRWREARPGRPGWALITGVAGRGKSRLAEEMLAWAERQGITAGHARAYASTANVGYSPLVDLLRSDSLRAGWEKLADPWLVELSRLLPEIHTARTDLPPAPALAEEWQKRRLFEALAQALAGDSRPRLLVLDDLHWADRESLESLAFLLHYPTPARLLLVGTARSDEMVDNGPLQTLIQEATAQGQLVQIPLAPLTPEETGQLAAQTGGVPLDDEAVRSLHQESGGNPLFIEEMVRLGDWRVNPTRRQSSMFSGLQSPAFVLPPKIQAVIQGRLARLSSEAREIIAQAAVLGRSFTYWELVAATALNEGALVDGLDELWQRRIIREVGGDGYDFSHDRIRDVAYGMISQARRRLLHRRAGEALQRVHRRELGPMRARLGYHFAAAGEALAAIEHYRQAASVALERYAHAEAAGYLSAAMTLAESGGDVVVHPLLAERERINRLARRMEEWEADLALLAQVVERLDDGSREAIRRRAGLRLAQHYHESWMGDSSRAVDLALEAVACAQAACDQALEAEALMRAGHELWGQGRFDSAQTRLEEAQRTALAAGLPSLAAASLERQAALQMFNGGSPGQIRSILADALRLYRGAGDQIGEVNILNKIGYLPLAQGSGDYITTLESYRLGLDIGDRIGNHNATIMIRRNLVMLYTCQGDYRQAETYIAQCRTAIQRLQDEPNRNILLNYVGFWLLPQGRLDEAKATQQEALAILQQQKQQLWAVKALTALGWIAFYGSDWREAEARATEAIAESEAFNEERQIAHSCTLRGWARLKQGRMDKAMSDFQRSVAILQRLEMENRAQEPLAGLAQAACLQGDVNAAHDQALPIARHLLNNPLDRTVDSFLAIHTVHTILCAVGDPLAGDVRGLAQAHLEYRAAHMDPAHLDAFWALGEHAAYRVAAEPVSPNGASAHLSPADGRTR